jgi:transcriptional regulator with XRE-family HTH domain
MFEGKKRAKVPDYDAETDLLFDEYLRTAEQRGEFAIPRMRMTRPSEITSDLRGKLVATMQQAQAERLLRNKAAECRSFGEFFKTFKQARSLNWKSIADYTKVAIGELGKIEKNELHPADLPPSFHQSLVQILRVTIEYYVEALKRLLFLQAEQIAMDSGLQFPRNDSKAEQDQKKVLQAWCASASDSDRDSLRRFEALIQALEKQCSDEE